MRRGLLTRAYFLAFPEGGAERVCQSRRIDPLTAARARIPRHRQRRTDYPRMTHAKVIWATCVREGSPLTCTDFQTIIGLRFLIAVQRFLFGDECYA